MTDLLIKGMELPKEGSITITIRHDGVINFIGDMGSNLGRLVDCKAIELSSHEETDLDLYDYIKQGSSFIKLNRIASELSFLIHCEKEKKIKDVLGRLVAMRNAIWDSVTLEASNKTETPRKARICPHYQGACGLDENIVCYASSSYEMCDIYVEGSDGSDN